MCIWEKFQGELLTGCGEDCSFLEDREWAERFKFCPFCGDKVFQRLIPREFAIHVNQTRYSEKKEKGNCFPACISSLYKIELGRIPNFAEQGDYWYPCAKKWLQNSGISLRRVNLDGTQEDIARQISELRLIADYFIVTGRSPRSPKIDHAVVVNKKGAIVNDPHPSSLGLATFESLLVLSDYPSS